MEIIDYFIILKAFIILMLFFWMDSFLNQNGKVLEETLAGSNSNAVKTTLRGLPNSKMTLPFCNFLKNL